MRIELENTCAVLIDVQEKLLPVMSNKVELLASCDKLIKGLTILNVPLLVTEQYPKGLGNTVLQLKDQVAKTTALFEKTSFSVVGDAAFLISLHALKKDFVLVFGIESHVCVLQSVIDLVQLGFMPVVVVDSISSRKSSEIEIAIKRMEKEGAIITTSEAILFELCAGADHPSFKLISALVRVY